MSRGGRTDSQLAAWAQEHLVYEVETMVFALEQLEGKARGMMANLALESFAVHARCLFDFLWGKPSLRFDNDAFASDFSDEWNGRCGATPADLAKVKDRERFGREVFHLTYDRIDGADERKSWPCGLIALELAQAPRLFAELARPASLTPDTRGRLQSLLVEEDGKPVERIATLDLLRLRRWLAQRRWTRASSERERSTSATSKSAASRPPPAMAEGLFIGVVGGLIVAAILGLIGWLRQEDNRTRVRQMLCQHDWFSPMDEFNEPGSAVVFLTPVSEECRKCGKTR